MAKNNITKMTQKEENLCNALLALHCVFHEEFLEAKKQKKYFQALKLFRLRNHVIKMTKTLAELEIIR